MEEVSARFYVSGHVQGVFYRAKTKEKAETLGILGTVANLPDGRVEVNAQGPNSKILEFYEWLQRGPEQAKVKFVTYEEVQRTDFQGFEIIG